MTKLHAGLAVTVIVVFTVLVLGGVGVGFTVTESMDPVISSGDAYVTVDNQPVRTGSIVVYETTDGRRVVHTVVDVTDEGYVTKGVNNDVTDQDAGIDVVKPTDVTATVLLIDGVPVHVPFIGYILNISGLIGLWILFAGGIVSSMYLPGVRHIRRIASGESALTVIREHVNEDIRVSERDLVVWVSITTLASIASAIGVWLATPMQIPVTSGEMFTVSTGALTPYITPVVETSGQISVSHVMETNTVVGSVESNTQTTTQGLAHVYLLPGGSFRNVSLWLYSFSPWVAGGVIGSLIGVIVVGVGVLIGKTLHVIRSHD